jgi:radical SAM protein with 4Fe4S-binding SPASM domain
MDKTPNYCLFLDMRTRRDSLARNRLISSLRLSPEEGVKMLARQEIEYRKEMAQFCSKFIGQQGDRLFSCSAGESGCVDAYGVYQMCMMLRHPQTVYDLKQGTLREAMTETFPLFRETRAINPDFLERCAHCFIKGMCEQCPAKSWTENGTLDTPVEYLCEVAHAQARFLGLLDDHERAWEIDLAVSRERLTHFVNSQA